MNKFILCTDSSTDWTNETYERYDIPMVSLRYTIDDVEQINEHNDETCKIFFDKMRRGSVPQTSAVSQEDYLLMWNEQLKKGMPILQVAFTSGLSATCQNAFTALEMLKESNPEADVKVIDSNCASMGQALLMLSLIKLRDEGKTREEVMEWITQNSPKIAHDFTVDDLAYLKRGGRVSGVTAFVGTMLDIKPIMHMDDEGHLQPLEKIRGRKKSLRRMVERMKERMINPEGQVFTIMHGDCLEDALYVEELAKEMLGIDHAEINYVGTVIGSHTGPGLIAISYWASNRK